MGFFRVAKEEDFRQQLSLFDCIPEEIRSRIIRQKKVDSQTITFCHTLMKDRTSQECQQLCQQFFSIVKAYGDYISGETVYTTYMESYLTTTA